jgi:hypothetical protein
VQADRGRAGCVAVSMLSSGRRPGGGHMGKRSSTALALLVAVPDDVGLDSELHMPSPTRGRPCPS